LLLFKQVVSDQRVDRLLLHSIDLSVDPHQLRFDLVSDVGLGDVPPRDGGEDTLLLLRPQRPRKAQQHCQQA